MKPLAPLAPIRITVAGWGRVIRAPSDKQSVDTIRLANAKARSALNRMVGDILADETVPRPKDIHTACRWR